MHMDPTRQPCAHCPRLVELDELRAAVADMRHAQREYFRTRSTTAMAAARRAEARVDRLLSRRHPRLF